MAHFFAPVAGSTDGYEDLGKVAPNSVSKIRLFAGQTREIALWGGKDSTGKNFKVESSDVSVILNDGFAESLLPDGSRKLQLTAKSDGTAKLKTWDQSKSRWGDVKDVSLDVVVEKCPSYYSDRFTLAPKGLTSYLGAKAWLDSVKTVMDNINRNAIGMIVLQHVTHKVRIIPNTRDIACNAYAGQQTVSSTFLLFIDTSYTQGEIQFTPSLCTGGGCGDAADEILVHEFVHQLEDNYGGYSNSPVPTRPPAVTFEFGSPGPPVADFMTVTITNLYTSTNGRRLRKDHVGFLEIPAAYMTDPAGPQRFFVDFQPNFDSFKDRESETNALLETASTTWNPFKFRLPPPAPAPALAPVPTPAPNAGP